MSYERMTKEEERLKEEVNALLKQADGIDEQEDAKYGKDKQGRGFRQFLLRGLQKVKGEWSLICTTHNLLKLWRAGGMSLVKPPSRCWAAG